jgi:hypothetical protein
MASASQFRHVRSLARRLALTHSHQVLALERGDVEAVARIYREAGYRASWHSGTRIESPLLA